MNGIFDRRSIRKFKSDIVNREDIETIIKAGMVAPSAKNRQPWKYIVYNEKSKNLVTDAMEKGLIREQTGEKLLPKSQFGIPDALNTLRIMKEAPVLIIIENTNGHNPYEPTDSDGRITEICDSLSIGASVQNILITATKMGYGTLWIANTCFAYNELVKAIDIKGQLAGIIALGKPDENPNPRPRKDIVDILEFK